MGLATWISAVFLFPMGLQVSMSGEPALGQNMLKNSKLVEPDRSRVVGEAFGKLNMSIRRNYYLFLSYFSKKYLLMNIWYPK